MTATTLLTAIAKERREEWEEGWEERWEERREEWEEGWEEWWEEGREEREKRGGNRGNRVGGGRFVGINTIRGFCSDCKRVGYSDLVNQ